MLSVKNFERFQHYKDRAPPWIKLYNSLLEDYAFGLLRDASKAHLIAIWLLASRSDNKLPDDATWIAKRINATEPVDLDELVAAGFIVRSGSAQRASKPQADRLPRERGREEAETEQREREIRARDDADFDVFWSRYPNKVGKPAARKAFASSLKRAQSLENLLYGLERYIETKPPDRQWLNPSTFLNQDRWADDPAPVTEPRNAKLSPADSLALGTALALAERERARDRSQNHDPAEPLLDSGGQPGVPQITDGRLA